MCCFAGPVESVSDTRIFARFVGKARQALAYEMRFATKELNAMILPLPTPVGAGEQAVQFVSLKKYDRMFADFRRAFPEPTPPAGAIASRALGSNDAPKLAVHDVGDFVASFVPTVNDFSRLDPRFVIPKSAWDKIPVYSDYGFAVFQLKSLRGKTHPMAFHFDSRWSDKLFFPTVHIHDGEVHAREEFDHELYLQHETLDRRVGPYKTPRSTDRATGFVRSAKKAGEVCNMAQAQGMIAADQLLHRRRIQGVFKNEDVIVDLAKIASRPNPTGQALRSWAPAGAALGIAGSGLAWLIARRMKLEGRNAGEDPGTKPTE